MPIAICRKTLATDDLNDTGALRPEAYWKVLFPAFHGFDAPLDATALDCVGNGSLAEGEPKPAPLSVSATDLTVASSKDGFQAVWLHGTAPERTATGPLAVVRLRSSQLDVYAIGRYRGSSHQSRLDFGRIGSRMIIAAKDDACADVKVGTECENKLAFYLVDGGQLAMAAETSTDRLQYGTMKDVGRVQYRLTTDPPVWDATSVHIRERLSVRDSRRRRDPQVGGRADIHAPRRQAGGQQRVDLAGA